MVGYSRFRSVLRAGITGSSLSTPQIHPFAKLLVCFNVVDIWAKVLFKEGLKESDEGTLGLCAGNTSHDGE